MLAYLLNDPLTFSILLIAILIAITIHEFSHALMADYLGDPTPRLTGRLSLNPFVHIDSIGLLFLLIFGFGWGKPVVFDPFNLKDPRRDAAFISIAGPTSNFILALVTSILMKLIILFNLPFLGIIGQILIPVLYLNIILGVFNLLPIHPLDGFKIVEGILPDDKALEWKELERYGLIFLLMLIFPFGNRSLLDFILRPIISYLMTILTPIGLGGGII